MSILLTTIQTSTRPLLFFELVAVASQVDPGIAKVVALWDALRPNLRGFVQIFAQWQCTAEITCFLCLRQSEDLSQRLSPQTVVGTVSLRQFSLTFTVEETLKTFWCVIRKTLVVTIINYKRRKLEHHIHTQANKTATTPSKNWPWKRTPARKNCWETNMYIYIYIYTIIIYIIFAYF